MQVFLMHIGHPGHIDIDYTVTEKRAATELLENLPVDAPERTFFEGEGFFHQAFPTGQFNCWGVPPRAAPSFERTSVGDLVLIVPWIGVHDGGIRQLGIVKAKCPMEARFASPILWPNTPYDRLYPWLIFFDTEVGRRDWYDFLQDVGYDDSWNPRGWYRRIKSERFRRWGGPEHYLQFLRNECSFSPL
jgi:hypothetical protein